MNSFGMVIAVNLLATFVIFCGLKLFDMRSTFSEPIRRFGPALGLVFLTVAIFNFLLKDTFELMKDEYVPLVVIVSMLAFSFVGFLSDISKRNLLVPKRKESRRRGRMSNLSVVAIGIIDALAGCVTGAVAGLSFVLNFGTGIVVLCSLILLQIVSKVASIRRYQDAFMSRRENITVLAVSLLASPITAILVNAWARPRYHHVGVLMAVAVGYLAYIGLYHLVLIVKKLQNR